MENKNMELDNLVAIEWEVYHFLKQRSKHRLWTSQLQVLNYLQQLGYKVDSLRPIRQYVQNIRKCNRIQKIIISGDYGYKILTNPEEEKVYLERKKESALRKLKQYYRDVKRLNKNGQMKFKLGTQDREFFESILKESD